MRKGFDGLASVVRQSLGRDATSGDMFLFVSRNRIRAKVLLWDGTGLCLYSKRLERGRFPSLWQRSQGAEVALTVSELHLFLEGCKEVGRRPLSPPEVSPQLALLSDGYSVEYAHDRRAYRAEYREASSSLSTD
jgi:transposase